MLERVFHDRYGRRRSTRPVVYYHSIMREHLPVLRVS